MEVEDPEKVARLVVLIGLDGAGKSTQASLLLRRLKSVGRDAVLSPSTSLLTLRKAMDKIAVTQGHTDMYDLLTPNEAHLLISLIKWDDMLGTTEELRVEDRYVVMDRFSYCYFAGGVSLGASKGWIVRELFSVFPAPDLTIYLDVPPHEALRRIDARGVDSADLEVLESMRTAYWKLPESSDYVVVDGTGTSQEVHAAIWDETVRTWPELKDAAARASG